MGVRPLLQLRARVHTVDLPISFSKETGRFSCPINMASNSNGRCMTWGYLLGRILLGVEISPHGGQRHHEGRLLHP